MSPLGDPPRCPVCGRYGRCGCSWTTTSWPLHNFPLLAPVYDDTPPRPDLREANGLPLPPEPR